MTRRYILRLVLALFLPAGWGGPLTADSLDCSNTTRDVELAICAKSELSELAALADVLGSVTGLEIRYSDVSIDDDFNMSAGIRRLLSTLTPDDIDTLVDLSRDLAWDFHFDDQNKILFINANNPSLQDGLVVFHPGSAGYLTPAYAAMESVYDAVRYQYMSDGNILEITSSARPARFIDKYRYQDGCWRLIGTDARWAGYMIEFDDDLDTLSVNHLTGRAIFDFKKDKGIVRTFDPLVWCLGQRRSFQDIIYHDADGR